MRMVLVAPFAIKRCRLKKPVLEGERKLIPNQPSFCAKTESFLYAQKSFPHSRSLRRKNPEGRSAPRTGGSIGPILLRPFSVAALRIPQRSTCGWFWVPFDIKRYKFGNRNGCHPVKRAFFRKKSPLNHNEHTHLYKSDANGTFFSFALRTHCCENAGRYLCN